MKHHCVVCLLKIWFDIFGIFGGIHGIFHYVFWRCNMMKDWNDRMDKKYYLYVSFVVDMSLIECDLVCQNDVYLIYIEIYTQYIAIDTKLP